MAEVSENSGGPQRFPFGIFWTCVILICLALALSAAHTYTTLGELRNEYLRSRGNDVVAAVEHQTRGPGRRNNPQIWQEAFGDVIERDPEMVASISLVDSTGITLAHAGANCNAPRSESFYLLEVELETGRGRGRGQGIGPGPSDWQIEIALYSEQADFIGRQAIIHTVIAGIAVLTLLGLAFYFVRTLNRFLELEKRAEKERQLAALGAMSATLAHEIRNPLGAMKGLTQVVQEDLPEEHRSQELMKTVVAEARRLEQLVTDLLTFARPAELRLTHFDLAELITEVINLLTPQADESGVALEVPDEAAQIMVHSDSDGLRQILLNLVINAVEVTPRNGTVDVSLVHDSKLNQAVIKILDDGPGLGDINPEDLFEPFRTTKFKGSGLGLAVTRQIVQRLRGSISLENHLGGGTLCILRVPINSPPSVDARKL